MTDFGPVLKARREERAPLSQTALAGRVGCSASLISRLESGGRRPDRDLVRRLADILGLTGAARAEVFLAADYLPDNITDWSYTDEEPGTDGGTDCVGECGGVAGGGADSVRRADQ